MNPDPQPWPGVTTITYDTADRLTVVRDPSGQGQDPPSPPQQPPPKPRAALFAWEHDREKGIVRITWPDGEVEVFRDKPVRYLVVEPDPETGEPKPVVQRGVPRYL